MIIPGWLFIIILLFLLIWVLPQCFNVGLNNDVYKWLQQTDNQPNVYHLDISSRGQIGADAKIYRLIYMKICNNE